MALLVCHVCGRIVDTTVPHEAQIAAEGRATVKDVDKPS